MLIKLVILVYLLIGNAYTIWHDQQTEMLKTAYTGFFSRYPEWLAKFGLILLWTAITLSWPYKVAPILYYKIRNQLIYMKYRNKLKFMNGADLPFWYWNIVRTGQENDSVDFIVVSPDPPEDTTLIWKNSKTGNCYEFDGKNWVNENHNAWKCKPGDIDECNCKQPHDCWFRDRGI